MNEKVLVVGRSPEMMRWALQSLQEGGFQARGVLSDDDALETMKREPLDALLLGGGVPMEARATLRNAFLQLFPRGVIYEHSMSSKYSLVDGLQQAIAAK